MWVLSTARAELHFFGSPEEVTDGFAALSHVWNKPGDGPLEQSFQDLRKIQMRCARKGTNPRYFVGEKIRRCCELAESHGYKWVWIDTCCIDKTSSAELSETINSMFRYYALARICYGYLRDVPDLNNICNDHLHAGAFTGSIWFNRGWKLQELIAPRLFVFLSKHWRILGTKADFAKILQYRHGIPESVLRLEVSHSEFSIAQRMSWSRFRRTTRVEDEAYCLLGLFDIHMPPLYGEGRNAFRRLQEEIMRQYADTTLFAWDGEGVEEGFRSCLLAPSPSAFREMDITYTPPRWNKAQASSHIIHNNAVLEYHDELHNDMSFSITPQGILAYVPLIAHKGMVFADLYWSNGRSSSESWRLLLLLKADASQEHESRRPLYRVSKYPRTLLTAPPTESGVYTIHGRSAFASWRTILIKHRPSPHRLPGQLSDAHTPSFIPAVPTQLTLNAPFRFDEASIQRFMHECKVDKVEVRHAQYRSDSRLEMPTIYIFMDSNLWDGNFIKVVVIKIGQCCREGFPRGGRPHAPAIWAKVQFGEQEQGDIFTKVLDDAEHDCRKDHVSRWPALQKSFHALWIFSDSFPSRAAVSLSFRPCPLNPAGTLVMDASVQRIH